MSSIDKFKATLGKRGGVAQQNRFQVIFTPPTQSLLNLNPTAVVGVLRGESSAKSLIADPRDISLLCESASLPGRQIASIDYTSNKITTKIPYSIINEDVTLNFILTNDYYMKTMMDDWQSAVYDSDIYRVGYKKDFTTDVIIQQLDKDNKPVYGVKLEDAFPVTVSSVVLDNTAENTAQKLSVTLSYSNYTPEGPISSTGSAIRSAVSGLFN
jgi:hypothetical protein